MGLIILLLVLTNMKNIVKLKSLVLELILKTLKFLLERKIQVI